MPRLQQLCFALRLHPRAAFRICRPRRVPRQRVANGIRQWTERQARGDRYAAIDREETGCILFFGNPQRHFDPRADIGIEQELLIHPSESGQ